MLAGHDALRNEMLSGHDALRNEMLSGHETLRNEIQSGDNDLRDGIGSLRQEMQAGFKDFGVRLGAIGDRLSKLEGIIEGLFWSGRNQPPDKPREGVA